jgi:predicted AAA+ superfamily ATPase
MQRLLGSGVAREQILYINFEDDRLRPLDEDVLAETLETFYRLNPSARTRGAHLFFDEIQVVEGWSRFARRVLDTENASLYISGSSAKMLSTEVATEFRGRGFAVELLPFSYVETLLADGLQLPTATPGSRMRSQLEAAFDLYLRVGGFPDVRSLDERERVQVLQDYVQLVLLRDIIERHEISNVYAARTFALALLQSSGSKTSVSKIARDLKSRGVAVGKDTLHALLDYFSDAFLLFTIAVFGRSLRVRESNPKKVYAIDPGLVFAVAPAGTDNLGARLENAVYIELRRRVRGAREGSISYYSTAGGREVDFVVGDPETGHATELVQACADMANAATRERELHALREAMAELGLRHAVVVSLHDTEHLSVEEGTIDIVPAWAWMLKLQPTSVVY